MSRAYIYQIPYLIAALIPALTFHEWSHAFMAHLFGDETARQSGRLSLNPLVHLDPLGTLMIFLVGFGWAKPVPIESSRFRSVWGGFCVAIAGITMNVILALFFAALFNWGISERLPAEDASILDRILIISVSLNLMLAFFNLIPLGPLDGSHIIGYLLPKRLAFEYEEWNLQFGGWILFGLFVVDSFGRFHILGRLISVPTDLVTGYLLR